MFRLAAGLGGLGAGSALSAAIAACGPFVAGGGQGKSAGAATCRSRLEFLSPFASATVQYQGFSHVATAFAQQRAACAVEIVPVTGGANAVAEKLATTLAGGSPPALTVLPPSNVTTWSARGLIVAVDDLFKRDRLSSADFPGPLWKQMNYGSKVWFMPLFVNPDFVLHWNKAHFRAAGLNPERGPETIAELERLIQVLTRREGDELVQVGMHTWDLYGHANTIQTWGYAFGGAFHDAQKDEMTFTHPRILRATEWYTGWAHRLGVDRANRLRRAATVPAGVHFFGSGRFSIHVLAPPGLRGVQQHEPTMEIGAGLMPAEAPGRPGAVALGGQNIGAVPGPTREEAWDFMKYIGASEEGTAIIARQTGIPGWLKSPGLAELSKDPLQKAYVDGVRRAQHVQLGFLAPVAINYAPLQEVIDGKRGVRDALETINQQTNQAIKELKEQLSRRS
jgi:multiple sugar transport system substrate-binding protein